VIRRGPADSPSPAAAARARSVVARSFFLQPTLQVARELLGMVLVHDSPAGRTAGRIVEVEAYRGPADRAAHSAGGRHTPRNAAMWGPPGHAYVYFIYGMHWCMNVVTQPPGVPEAVLLRALDPLCGLELMRERRAAAAPRVRSLADWELCRGPGALCRAMGIDGTLNGVDLRSGPLRLLEGDSIPRSRVARTARIGVAYAGRDATRPWRFAVRGCRAVSAPRPPAAIGRPVRPARPR